MRKVTLSPKYQVVSPADVRKAMDLRPGEKAQVLAYADRVEWIPVRPLKDLRGFPRGMDTVTVREAARHPLPLAAGLIDATALNHNALLRTQDADFERLPDLRYFPR